MYTRLVARPGRTRPRYATKGVLFVVDGGRAAAKAIADVYGDFVPIQRCRRHKKRSVAHHLPSPKRPLEQRKLRSRLGQPPTYQRSTTGGISSVHTACPERRMNRPSTAAGLSKADILRIAAEEFASRGYDSTNLGHVAARLGVTRQALYYYFPRKAEILVTLFRDHFAELNETLARVNAESDPARRSEDLLRALARFIIARPDMSRIFVREDGRLPLTARKAIEVQRSSLHRRFVDAYEAGVKTGRLRRIDSDSAVSLQVGAIAWIHRWFHDSGGLSADQMADFVTDVLLSGIARSDSASEE